MFGYRADGRRIRGMDPIVSLTPYIMPRRYDAQVQIRHNLDFDVMTRYIREKREQGHNVTYMGLLLAAYVRTVSQYPELNRFIMNRQLYARNHICVSFVTLKKGTGDDRIEESLVKLMFEPDETVFEVTDKLEAAIEENRKATEANLTEGVARFLLAVPLLPGIVVMLGRLLDRYGLLPSLIHRASPFHTSLFISNMASIGMGYIYHHIYDFGTTSVFVSMGRTEQEVRLNGDGSPRSRRIMPLGTVVDERICSGGEYARAFGYLRSILAHPEQLETRPEVVKTEMRPSRRRRRRDADKYQINA
ncbi:MAG: 2-oxo acid dehydrogenase subunit E2 [Clostridiales bacterium]|nr:2-oxo acid dehydrogenase subunit E2 [Clostridiales bacterium]